MTFHICSILKVHGLFRIFTSVSILCFVEPVISPQSEVPNNICIVYLYLGKHLVSQKTLTAFQKNIKNMKSTVIDVTDNHENTALQPKCLRCLKKHKTNDQHMGSCLAFL